MPNHRKEKKKKMCLTCPAEYVYKATISEVDKDTKELVTIDGTIKGGLTPYGHFNHEGRHQRPDFHDPHDRSTRSFALSLGKPDLHESQEALVGLGFKTHAWKLEGAWPEDARCPGQVTLSDSNSGVLKFQFEKF